MLGTEKHQDGIWIIDADARTDPARSAVKDTSKYDRLVVKESATD